MRIKILFVRLAASLHMRAMMQSAREGISMSELGRRAVAEYLEKRKEST